MVNIKKVPIRRHRLVLDLNPYLDENKKYFSDRQKRNTLLAGLWTWKQKRVLKQTGGICKVCEEILVYQDVEMHHIQPKSLGGKDTLQNLIMLHKMCHTQVTHTKSIQEKARFVNQGILEKVSIWKPDLVHYPDSQKLPCLSRVR